MKKIVIVFIALCAAILQPGCGKMDDLLKGVNVEKLMTDFFESWKAQDWKKMHTTIHSSTIAEYRTHQTDAQRKMNDVDFFKDVCSQKVKSDPSFVLKEYSIVKMPIVRKGNQEIKVLVKINGADRTIPVKLDGMAFRVDFIKIK